MANELVLITGGAGFIGSHTADALLTAGYRVRALDNLNRQIHPNGERPDYLDRRVELVEGDVRDLATVRAALRDVDFVYHLAAETGVGQSMYEIGRYLDTNVHGTGVLWDALADLRGKVKKVVLASSRAVYGEGKFVCPEHGPVYPAARDPERLRMRDWTMRCPSCDRVVEDAPTPESSPLQCTSIYGLTKKYQEEICRLMGHVHGIPVMMLRYFNVYGPRQSPTNPYTGVIVAFLARLANKQPIVLYEEGVPRRDFVHVSDVVQANVAALQTSGDGGSRVFNVGSGASLNLRQVAEGICSAVGRTPLVEVTTRHRVGDILSCYADLSSSRDELGYEPRMPFDEGIRGLSEWVGKVPVPDRSELVEAELRTKGLLLDE